MASPQWGGSCFHLRARGTSLTGDFDDDDDSDDDYGGGDDDDDDEADDGDYEDDYNDNGFNQVENIGVEGEGKYTCVATNTDGSVDKIVDVEVFPSSLSLTVSSSFTLTSSSSSSWSWSSPSSLLP